MSGSQADLRASDAEREAVLGRLREAYVEGRLTLEECDERMDAALNARTHGELATLTRDLPARPGVARPVATPSGGPTTPAPAWTVSIMSDARRNGRWRIDGPLNALALMSSVQLDLRQAELQGDEIVINVYVVMGSIRLIVPEGVGVEFHEISVMGSVKDARISGDVQPGMPTVRVRGFGLMGSLEVRNEEQTLLGKLSERLGRIIPPTPPGTLPPPPPPSISRHQQRIERRIERHLDRIERHERRGR